MFNRRTSVAALTALLTLSVTALAGCGGSGGSLEASTGADGKKLTTVKVGVLPISALAPLHLGIKKGIFEKHGLKVEPQLAQAGAAIVPAVVSGERQFGFANVVSLMVARDKGLPIKIVAKGSQAGPGESQKFEGVIVKKDSPIRKPSDLAGKTIAVNAVNDIGGLLISGALQKAGVDPKSIKFLEIGFPDVNAAVKAGRVDAAYQTEPFLYQGKKDGLRVVLYQYPELGEKIAIADYFTSEQMEKQHPDVVKNFRAAMNESLEYATAHEDEVRQIVPTFTKIPPEAAEKMTLPGWNPDLDPESSGLALVGRLAAESKIIKKQPDFGELIAR